MRSPSLFLLLFMLSLFLLLFTLLAPRVAQAQTYSATYHAGDRYWQVVADVRAPLNTATYVSSNGSYSSVPHRAWYQNRINAATQAGLSSHFYTNVGNLQRYDRGQQFWRYFPDEIRGAWQPSSSLGNSYSYYGWYNPPSYSGYWDSVTISPLNTWHLCDAITESTDHNWGYARINVSERVYYKVRPQ